MNTERSKSLAPHTGKVFEAISKLECIKPFTLVGGTALSLQIEKRQSEDLDFMKWLAKRNEKPEVNWPSILKELESIGSVKNYDVIGFDQVVFNFEDVNKLRTRGLFKMLTTGQNFIKEKGFEELMPVYDVTHMDIQEFIKAKLLEAKSPHHLKISGTELL